MASDQTFLFINEAIACAVLLHCRYFGVREGADSTEALIDKMIFWGAL